MPGPSAPYAAAGPRTDDDPFAPLRLYPTGATTATSKSGDTFSDPAPALPAAARQATHPALTAARSAATSAPHKPRNHDWARMPLLPGANDHVTGVPPMPSAAMGQHGSVSPSAYAQQFQSDRAASPSASPHQWSSSPHRALVPLGPGCEPGPDSAAAAAAHSPRAAPTRKASLLQRSLSAFSSSRNQHLPPSQQALMSSSGRTYGSPSGQGAAASAGVTRKPSTLRRSMARLFGHASSPSQGVDAPAPPLGPPRLAPGMGDSPSLDAEKQSQQRDTGGSAVWGAAGDGNEWDVHGSAAGFWTRFGIAQQHAQDQADPLTMQSKRYLRSEKRATSHTRAAVIVVLILVVALAVGLGVGIPLSHKSKGTAGKDPSASTSETSSSASASGTGGPSKRSPPLWTQAGSGEEKLEPQNVSHPRGMGGSDHASLFWNRGHAFPGIKRIAFGHGRSGEPRSGKPRVDAATSTAGAMVHRRAPSSQAEGRLSKMGM